MRDDEILTDLRRLADSAGTLEELLGMEPDRVERLLRLLSDRAAIGRLRRLLASVKAIQTTPASPRPTVSSAEARASEPRSMEEALRDLFSDSSRFPTVASIAEFCREAFGLRVPHAKKGRKRYISSVLTAFRKSPKARHHARNLLAHGKVDEKDERYQLLYKFIRGSLTE